MTCEAAREAQRSAQLRAAIAVRLERSDTLDSVERELIAASRLSEEQQAALWLYGWALLKRGRRRLAFAGLDTLPREGRAVEGPRRLPLGDCSEARCRT